MLSEISKIVFNDDDAAKWLERYKEYKAKNNVNGQKHLEDMRAEVQRLDKQIENLAFSIAESTSSSRALVGMIDQLERQKDDIQRQIDEAERITRVVDVTEEDVRYHYGRARELFNSGQLPEIRQLINLYMERAVVYKEHVDIFLHVLPSFCGVNHEMFENYTGKEKETPLLKETAVSRGLL